METIKGFLGGVFSQGSKNNKEDDDAEVQSSSSEGEDNEVGAPSNINNDRHVTFEVQSETDDDNITDNAGGKSDMNMNGMEYLTQPDQEEEESDDDQSSNNNNKMQVEEHTPPPPSISKKRRAHKHSIGDSLTQLNGSPEGRQHSSTIKSSSKPAPQSLPNSNTTLSQAVVNSPLRSPSPLTMMMSQQTAGAMLSNPLQSPLVDDKTSPVKNGESDSISVSEYKLQDANLQANSPLPTKDDAPMDESNVNDNSDKKQPAIEEEDEIIDFGTTSDPTLNGFHDIPSKEKQLLLHKLNMKKQAIYRSLLHLSDNSYSFVYDESSNGQTTLSKDGMNDDDEQGLPYIGPHLKDDYKVLRTMLRRGLLGITDDNDTNTDNSTTTRIDTTEGNGDDTTNMNNPFLPKIKANVSAVLMGPRGHGKTLVLERCLASLSRLAAKRKEQVLDQMMESNPRQAEEMYSQASFRVVRLNGLLFQGDSAVACTREIARQIGVMSREERKRTRKIMKQMNTKRKLQGVTDDLETPSFKRQRKKDKSSSKKNSSAQKKHPSDGDTPLPNLTQTPSDNPTPNNTTESHDLRNRRSGFNTYIALLDEVLRTARVDGIPILIVLDELQAFLNSGRSVNTDVEGGGSSMQQDVGSSDRQLLLYHLLDRVADHKFLVSVVGLTTDLRAVTKLEKRVQSRAEGTSKIIYFGHNKDFDELAKCLLGKFYTPPEERSSGESNNDMAGEEEEYSEQMAMIDIREEVKIILTGGKSNSNRLMSEEEEENGEINDFALVQRVLERNYSLIGSDMRWICRVFDVALGLLVSDIDERIHQCMESNDDNCGDDVPTLSASHVAKALITMNASMDDVSSTIGRPGIPSQSTLELISWGKLLGDTKHYSCLVGTHPRLVALLDMSGPQVAALLAARRIEARDDARANAGEDEIESRRRRGLATNDKTASTSLPLTYKRIEDEYTTSFVASGRYTISSDRYPKHVLYRSFMDLMEMDIIRLKKEICGGGALQYGHNDALSSGSNMSGLPLYVNLDYDLELMPILKAGMLQCSTALREWGLKMN